MKRKKVDREDAINNKAYLFAPEKLQDQMLKLFNKVWVDRQYSPRWKIGGVEPVLKRSVER